MEGPPARQMIEILRINQHSSRNCDRGVSDGGPGDQTIARTLEHMRKPSGWHNSDKYQGQFPEKPLPKNYRGSLPGRIGGAPGQERKGGQREERDRASASYRMGRAPGWRKRERQAGVTPKSAPEGSEIKANESFHASVVDVVENRNKRSVWTIASEGFSDAHFSTYPRKLVRPCILAGSRIGDVVLDMFIGSGTTAIEAQNHGRKWIGIELSPNSVTIAEKRIRKETAQLDFITGAQ